MSSMSEQYRGGEELEQDEQQQGQESPYSGMEWLDEWKSARDSSVAGRWWCRSLFGSVVTGVTVER